MKVKHKILKLKCHLDILNIYADKRIIEDKLREILYEIEETLLENRKCSDTSWLARDTSHRKD